MLQVDRNGLRFLLFGFPTRIQPSFVLVVLILGIFPGATVASVAIWTAVAAVSILWHELGHAVAARRLGADPTIELYSFGGLTHWRPATDASRWQLISVAAAGPVAGLILGGLVAGAAALSGDVDSEHLRFFVVVMLWINVGWGLVNLLPVLPLDGGHILAELLPGERNQRWRRAAVVSVVTGGIAAVILVSIGYFWGGLVFGWAVATNITTLRTEGRAVDDSRYDDEIRSLLRRISSHDPDAGSELAAIAAHLAPERQVAIKVAAVESAAASGDAGAARWMLDTLPGPVPPALHALVHVAETGGAQGVAELEEIFRREPDRLHARWLTFGLLEAGRLHEVIDELHRLPPVARRRDIVEAVAGVAEWAGSDAVANAARAV
jgi:Zn-dependent protease